MTSPDVLAQLHTLLGDRAVLLPLPYGEKKPVRPGWQSTTFEDTKTPHYQKELEAAIDRGGNIGVLLEGGRAAIDIDNDEFIPGMLALNPALAKTLRSRGARGCQLWVRLVGDYPQRIHKLKKADGTVFGEWRGGGGAQSVIFGQHPNSTPEKPVRYARVVAKPVIEIPFSQLVWPSDLVLPWIENRPQTRTQSHQYGGSGGSDLHKRISAYIAAIPGAVSGENGHDQTYKVACELINGWALSTSEAMQYLGEYNQRCEPPWSDKELAHKLADAEKARHNQSRGHLRGPQVTANESGENKGQTALKGNEPTPTLVLPSGDVGYEQCAREAFPVLAASQRFFFRGKVPVELTRGKQGEALENLTPNAFRSRLEGFFKLFCIRQLGHGETALKSSHCSHDTADALLHTTAARELLPSVSVVTRAPIFSELNGQLMALKAGYHDILGGIIVLQNRSIRLIPLPDATRSLLSLLDDFDFVSPSDRSRAIATFISPALRFGGLLHADFPIDLAEANASQSGKTYRQKLVARLYGERPFVINKGDEKGVGSMSEFVSEGLISGRPFLMFENIRRKLDCQLLESALRGEGAVLCRTAYGKAAQVDPSLVCWMLSSNKAEVTPDLANRSIICRIRKREEGYAFKVYQEGDVLQHIQANADFYLSCIFSVVHEWHRSGKPHSGDTRHDFREWCQTLDFFVQDLFGLPPLLDGHRSEQQRISNPDLTWLREVALAVEKRDWFGNALKPSDIVNLCDAFSIDIPGASKSHAFDPEQDFKKASLATGKILARIFLNVGSVEIAGFIVRREEESEYNPNKQENLRVHYHYFERHK